jgi:hypothetical protein
VQQYIFAAGVSVMIAVLICPLLIERSKDIADISVNHSSVTSDDLNVFMWMKENIPESSVIANNYGDAGLWIPSIIGMPVTANDANAQYIHVLDLNTTGMHEDYIFVGAKQVYENSAYIASELETNQDFEVIYRSGQARLFRKISDSPVQ